ncbi:MAG: hypothetical protein JNK05_06710 [Myxococcales bacterium]|nr:hypothetical protein [Myxococcales bacterium]
MTRSRRALGWIALATALGSCAHQRDASHDKRGPAERAAQRARPRATRVTGAVTYEFRALTDRGYASATTTRPARFVIVRALDAAGATLAETSADADGRYALDVPSSTARIVARASVQRQPSCTRGGSAGCTAGMRIDVAPDREGRAPHELSSRWIAGTQTLSLHASLAEPQALGGAFHILDTLVTGMQTIHRWSGRQLAPFFVIWSHASGTDWSYYRGERPANSGRFALELMGGVRGQLPTTDADQHDVFIVLHEFGHFVFDTLASDSSIGGMHPATVNIDPGVAWEEGRATWLASAILGDSRYRDAVGIEPAGSLRQDDELEQLPPSALRGMGSQRTVEEVLWDLSDGTLADQSTPLADRDNDGVALGPARVFEAMLTAAREPRAYPSLVSYLRHLVATRALTEAQARAILERPQRQGIRYPNAGEPDPWPVDLAPSTDARNKIDGRTNPAPSGGRAHPTNGYDATHAYRIHVTRAGTINVTLTIQGTGRVRDVTDLDLELRDQRSDEVASARTEAAVETISRRIEPGTYVIYVRDGGNGNAARYSLRWSIAP